MGQRRPSVLDLSLAEQGVKQDGSPARNIDSNNAALGFHDSPRATCRRLYRQH